MTTTTDTRPAEPLIRIVIRSLYDMQKLRIQQGNRIVAAYRDKLGIAPGTAEEETPEAKHLLDQLRKECKRITDRVKIITKNTKIDSNLITSQAELRLILGYDHMLSAEHEHEKIALDELNRHAIYTEYLQHIKGVGPMMAAVILSEIDIAKCNSISALWAYAGLDVVTSIDESTGEVREEGRSMKRHHLVPKTYHNRAGEAIETVGISYNPFLKTKLVGVLATVFIKLQNDYSRIYYDYKHRIQNHPRHQGKTKSHLHHMALRYMMKEFLADLWTRWRTLEGLPVRPRYSEEKLGIIHSKAA